MDEIERYRNRLQRKWDRRYIRRESEGRRKGDYKRPRFWTNGFIIQFLVVLLGSLFWLSLLTGPTIK